MPRSRLIRSAKWITGTALVLYWLAMFTGTHVPDPGPIGSRFNDKILHFLSYGGLAFLLSLTWALQRMERRVTGTPPETRWQFIARFFQQRIPLINYLVVGSLVSFYGTFDEVTQKLTQRTCDVYDWLADTVGAITALCAFVLFMHVGRKRLANVEPRLPEYPDDTTLKVESQATEKV